MKETKSKYQKLRKKYNLPPFKQLNEEFNISLDNKDRILQDVITHILDDISNTIKTLESIIFVNPSSSPIDLYHARMLKEKKIDLFGEFKKLMSEYWKGKKAVLSTNEKIMANFIKNFYKKWTVNFKPKIMEIYEIFEKEWNNTLPGKEPDVMYHG